MNLTKSVYLSLLIILAACAAPPLPRSTTVETSVTKGLEWSDFTLGPNDLIRITVLGQPELNSPATGVRIAPDGTLSFPLSGPILVAGMTPNKAAETIETALASYLKKPSVSVSVIEYSSRRFYLFGEVRKTGPFPMDRPITALEALAMGGGFRLGANRAQAVIIRRQGTEDIEVIPFNAETPGPDGLVQVRNDDFLFVQKSGVSTFSENVLPYLRGIGLTIGQIASATRIYDRLYDD